MGSSEFRWQELKRRKIVQWALAYLAGAWVLVEVVDVIGGQFGIPTGVAQGVTILLAFGFLVTLVLAWYHGEKGRQRVSGPELLLIAGILGLAAIALTAVRSEAGREPARAEAGTIVGPGPPLADSIPFRSVAVLPLDNHSPAEQHAWFSEAMTEQITHALAQVPELLVPSRNSASRYPRSGLTLSAFASTLGVAHVIEGSVQRVENDVRITVQLIDAQTGEHLLSETYVRELTDILGLQAEIARQVADRLASTFTVRERERILAGSTTDAVAYDLYLRAHQQDELDDTIALLRQAIRHDPEFGLAWGDLGGTFFYWKRLESEDAGWTDSIKIYSDRATALIEDPALRLHYQALKIWSLADSQTELGHAIDLLEQSAARSPTSYRSLSQLALANWWYGSLPDAVRLYRHLARLDPLSPYPWEILSWLYTVLGLDEQAERAIGLQAELAPGDPGVWLNRSSLARLQGEFNRATALIDSAVIRGYPAMSAATAKGNIQLMAGDVEAATASFGTVSQNAVDSGEQLPMSPSLAYFSLLHGDTTTATAIVSRMRTEADLNPTDADSRYLRLAIPALLGDLPSARQALREYIAQGGRRSRLIRLEPEFKRVRQDSAFVAELVKLEEIVDRQRRRVERDLAGVN